MPAIEREDAQALLVDRVGDEKARQERDPRARDRRVLDRVQRIRPKWSLDFDGARSVARGERPNADVRARMEMHERIVPREIRGLLRLTPAPEIRGSRDDDAFARPERLRDE